MAQRSHVPQFGNWESGDNVPYTVYFDKARKGRGGGKMINPNDPEENPDLFSDNSSSAQGPTSGAIAEPEEPRRQKPGRTSHEQRRSREDGDLKQFTDNLGGRDNSEAVNQRHGGRGPEKGTAVPKFGAWDENNPASAEGFTHIFEKVREERQTGVERIPGPNEISYNNARRRQNPDDSAKSCCFPWGRK